MRQTLKRIALLVGRLGASIGLIWLVFSFGHFSFAQFGFMLSHVAGWPLAAAVGCFLIGILAASYKWRELLREQGIRVGILRVLRLTSIALFYNLVLPGQESGNAVKAVLLGRASHKANKVWASVLVDQVMVFLATAIITVVGLLLNMSLVGWPLWMGLACFCLVGALSVHALFLSERLARPLDRVLRPLSRKLRIPWKCGKTETGRLQCHWRVNPQLEAAPQSLPAQAETNPAAGWDVREGGLDGRRPLAASSLVEPSGEPLPGEWLAPLWDGLRSYRTTWHRLGYVLLLSLFYQLALVGVAFLFGMGLGIHVSFLNLAWVMTLVSLAQALPISFAGVGTRDGTLVYFLGMLGVGSALALGLSLSLLALNVLMGLPGAVIQLIPDRYLARKEVLAGPGVARWIGQIPLKIHDHQPLILPLVVWPRLAPAPQPVRRQERSLRRG